MPADISPSDDRGYQWQVIGEWLQAWQASRHASVPTGDPYLTPILSSDTEGVKFTKAQRWVKAAV